MATNPNPSYATDTATFLRHLNALGHQPTWADASTIGDLIDLSREQHALTTELADLYAARPDTGAILHAHAPFATALACHRRDIPPFHYMIARFGGDSVRCAGYATFGTQALSDATVAALAGRSACLMANHGMLVVAPSADTLMAHAIEFEMLCEHYWRARALGEPACLDAAEMADALARFSGYGQRQPPTDTAHD